MDPSRRSAVDGSLSRGLSLRLALVLLIALVALSAAVVLVAARASQGAALRDVDEAQAALDQRIRLLQGGWLSQADILRAQIEFSGLFALPDAAQRNAALTAYFAIMGGEGIFTHAVLTDARDGRVLWRFGTRSQESPAPQTADTALGWFYGEADATLYRAFAQRALVAGQAARLWLLVPIDQGLLAANTPQDATLELRWRDRTLIRHASAKTDEPLWVDSAAHPVRTLRWAGDAAGPELRIRRYGPAPIDVVQALAIAGLAGVAVAALGWAVLARWLNGHARHLRGLQSSARSFKTAQRLDEPAAAVLDAAALRATSEVRDLAADMRAMMQGLEASQRQLQEEGRRFKRIADQLPGFVYQYRLFPDGRSCFPFASEAIHSIYRVAPAQVQDDAGAVLAVFHPDDADRVGRSIRESAERLSPWECEFRVRFADGQTHWRLGRAVPERLADGGTLWHGFVTDIGQRKQHEADLKQVHATLDALVVGSTDAIFVKDLQGRYVVANQALASIIGRPLAEIVGADDLALFPGDLAERFRADDRRVMGLGATQTYEESLATPRGSRSQLTTKGALLIDGEVRGVFALLRDITERQQALDALRRSERQLRDAQRLAQLGHWELDLVSGALVWSDEIFRIFEIDPARFGATYEAFLNAIHPDDRVAVNRAYTQSLATRRPYAIGHRLLFPDGHVKHVLEQCETLYGADGQALRSTGTVQDVTAQVGAEQALRHSEERLRLALAAANQGLYDLDLRSGATVVSPEYARMLGYEPQEFVESNAAWRERLHPDDRASVYQVYEDYVAGRLPEYRVEFRQRTKDGQWKWILSLGSVQERGADGQPLRMLGTHTDITERKRAESELQQLSATLDARVRARTQELEAALGTLRQAQDELVRSEKLASLGSLVAGLAHELNTPLGNAVMMASTLAGRQQEFEAAMAAGLRRSALDAFLAGTQEIAAVLERNLQRAAELVGSFKQIAVDQSSYQRRSFELREVVQEIALALRPTLRGSGVVLVDDTPAGLRLDSAPGPLGQVLINLVNNAVLHAFEGRPPGSVRITAAPVGVDRLRLLVSDDGRGIERESLKRIFDPFFTTRLGQGGSGLGLHIVYTLVTGLLGGRIEVRSARGAGTEFCIELPCVAPLVAPAAAGA